MKGQIRCLCAMLVIGAGIALSATGPGASSDHFVLVNDNDYMGNNFGTALKLLGNRSNLSLKSKAMFATDGISQVSSTVTPTIQMVQHGPDTCVFLADGMSMDIASFLYPSLTKVGNYTDSAITNSRLGIVLAAHGNYLFVAYNGQTSQDGQIGAWRIERGCTLRLIGTYPAAFAVFEMAVTPNGQTLVISYDTDFYVGSFAIGAGGMLGTQYTSVIENGNLPWGLDITADSKYAIFDIKSNFTAIDIFVINSDGSLGTEYIFGGDGSLGNGIDAGWIRLSPDQKYLFVNDDGEHITTLNFSEVPIRVTFSGCFTTLRVPQGEPSVMAEAMATALPSLDGGALYVTEFANLSYVATLAVNSETGCTTEAEASPFVLTDANARIGSIVAWPARPF